MKVLIISHEADIDGMGGVVLAKLAFEKADYILTDTPKLPDLIQELYDTNEIYNYDMIYITDMWLQDPMLTKVANDRELNGKIFIFDHHKSAIEESFDRYPFTKIKISDEKGKCCGTSLFFEYLTDNNYLRKAKGVYQFSELTRKYDTWEWRTRYNEDMPNELNTLFSVLGKEDYIERMYLKLKNNIDDFNFDSEEELLIKYKRKEIENKVKCLANRINVTTVEGYEAGIVFVSSEYKNDLAQYLRDNNSPLDFLMLVSMESGNVSYRNINPNVNVRLIAEKFGGKGHDFAAGSKLNNEKINKIIRIITDEI